MTTANTTGDHRTQGRHETINYRTRWTTQLESIGTTGTHPNKGQSWPWAHDRSDGQVNAKLAKYIIGTAKKQTN